MKKPVQDGGTELRNPGSHMDNLMAGKTISQGHSKSDPVPIHPGCHGRDDCSSAV